MGTDFDYQKIGVEINNLERLYFDIRNKYDKFMGEVYNPMNDSEIWSGQKHDNNLESVHQLKQSYENIMNNIFEQKNYLSRVYDNYRRADSAISNSIN